MKLDTDSLAHTKWNWKYHIVFAPKYRRQVIYGKIKMDIGIIPPKYSVSQMMGYLKGKSTLMIFEKYANMKYKYGNRHFGCRGYYVDTVVRNKKAIAKYIRNQLQEYISYDQMTLVEYVDPFTSNQVKEGK